MGAFAALLAAVVAILALAGVFSNDDDDEQPTPATTAPVGDAEAPDPPARDEQARPRVATVRVGGRPTAVSAGSGGVWVADSFSRRATLLRSEAEDAEPISFELDAAPVDVVATGADAWYALPERQAVERRSSDDPTRSGEIVELDGFPSALAADEQAVYALSERAVERIDLRSGEVTDRFDVGGFASGIAVNEGTVWVVVDNRDLVRIQADTGEVRTESIDVREPFGVAATDGVAFVIGAGGEVASFDPERGAMTAHRVTVKGALDIATGEDVVWVTSSRRTVTPLDAGLQPIGRPIRVGDEAASVSVGDDAVWVANGGDGTLSRIEL